MDTKPKHGYKSTFLQLWPQWIAAFEVFLVTMMVGMAMGLLPPLLGLLNSKDSPYKATKADISWIASLIGLTKPLGVFMGSIATTYFGSKQSINMCVFFVLTAWMLLLFPSNIEIFQSTFVCIGFSLGSGMATYPMYIAEISDKNIRGRLMSFVMQGFMIGLLLGNLMGTHLSLRTYATTCIMVGIIFLITFFFIPQTPQHMIRLNKMEKAAKSMFWYHRSVNIKRELADLTEFLDSSPKLPLTFMLKAVFQNPVNRNMLLKMSFFCITLQVTGLPTIGEFMVIIFNDAQITAIKPTTMMSTLILVYIVGNWIPIFTMDKFKRKSIYSIACALGTLAMIGLAFTYTLIDYKIKNPNIQWITIISAILFGFSITVGIQPLFLTFTSEVFAPNVKTISISIVLMINGVMTFLTHKYFLFFVDLLTYKYLFYTLAVVTVLHTIFVNIFLPETNGKTLQEIQKNLNESRNNEIDVDPVKKALLVDSKIQHNNSVNHV